MNIIIPMVPLHESQIILLTISDINQEASIKLTFNDLNRFLKNPFINGNTYGYPIYCEAFLYKNRHKAQRKAKFYINKCRSASCMQGELKQASA